MRNADLTNAPRSRHAALVRRPGIPIAARGWTIGVHDCEIARRGRNSAAAPYRIGATIQMMALL
jgi:hypothetical protein